MAKVIRFCVKDETHTGDNVFLIHRPFTFSNPFTHIKDKKTKAKYVVATRDDAISLYNDYFERMLETSPPFKEEWDRLYEAYVNNDEIYLGCYCATDESCHGDVIADKLKKRAMKDMVKKMKASRQR